MNHLPVVSEALCVQLCVALGHSLLFFCLKYMVRDLVLDSITTLSWPFVYRKHHACFYDSSLRHIWPFSICLDFFWQLLLSEMHNKLLKTVSDPLCYVATAREAKVKKLRLGAMG